MKKIFNAKTQRRKVAKKIKIVIIFVFTQKKLCVFAPLRLCVKKESSGKIKNSSLHSVGFTLEKL